MALLLQGHYCRAHRMENSRMPFVNRAEADLNRFVNSSLTLLELQPQKTVGIIGLLHVLPGNCTREDTEDGFQFRKTMKETSDPAPEMFGS